MTDKEQTPKGISRRSFLKLVGGVAATAALAPNLAFAEGGVEPQNNLKESQKIHALILDKTVIGQEDRARYLNAWYRNDIGFPVDPTPEAGFTHVEDMGNGYKSHFAPGPDGTESKIITKDGVVVYKNVILGSILKIPFEGIDIPPLLTKSPTGAPTPAPEYGPDLFRFSFPDRGIAFIGPKTSQDWSFTPVYAIEAFEITSPIEYNASPWLNIASTPVEANNPQ